MKFKVGDKVKVIARKYGHHFNIGEIVKITQINKSDYTCESFNKHDIWWLKDNEVAEVKFTKSDLKDGDIVTYRNGNKRIVISGKLIDENGMGAKYLRSYDDQIKDENGCRNLDIVKVERPIKYETVFERKEEILDKTEKRYLANIIRPFRDRVKWIRKSKLSDNEYISIAVKNERILLPYFSKGTMYKEMEKDKEYTLKELGL